MLKVKPKKDWLNRHVDGAPEHLSTIQILVEYDGENEKHVCEWRSAPPNHPSNGFLGTATIIQGNYRGVGFHAWEQNNSEFVYYRKFEL